MAEDAAPTTELPPREDLSQADGAAADSAFGDSLFMTIPQLTFFVNNTSTKPGGRNELKNTCHPHTAWVASLAPQFAAGVNNESTLMVLAAAAEGEGTPLEFLTKNLAAVKETLLSGSSSNKVRQKNCVLVNRSSRSGYKVQSLHPEDIVSTGNLCSTRSSLFCSALKLTETARYWVLR